MLFTKGCQGIPHGSAAKHYDQILALDFRAAATANASVDEEIPEFEHQIEERQTPSLLGECFCRTIF